MRDVEPYHAPVRLIARRTTVDELDGDASGDASLDGVADVTGAGKRVGILAGVVMPGPAYDAWLGVDAADDEPTDDACACRCGCQHPVSAHGPATCQDCRHGRHRGSERRAHR